MSAMSGTKSESSKSAPPPKDKQKLWAILIDRFRRFAHRNFPRLFFKARIKESLAWYHARDAAKNIETTPDNDESIQLHCLWAVELYTPAHAEALASAFSALGWDKSEQDNNNPSVWLRKSRAGLAGGGWINLGFIYPPGSRRRTVWPERTAPLPDNVEYATAHLFNLTSSLTCTVLGFAFKPEYRLTFEDALRKEYSTYAERSETHRNRRRNSWVSLRSTHPTTH